MPGPPRVGVLDAASADPVRDAGGEPVPLELPSAGPIGVALAREWAADAAQMSLARSNLDAVLVTAAEPAELVGVLVAALRLDLPAVAVPADARTSAALAALGVAPTSAKPSEVVVGIGEDGGPKPAHLVEDFALANALRAHLSQGGGPEMLVHLAALAREAGDIGFSQMLRVLTPETPTLVDRSSGWFDEHGVAGLLATMGRALHETETVSGRLHEDLPDAPPDPPSPGDSRLVFVRGRASGTEALLRVGEPASDVAGECRCYASEEDAVRGIEDGTVEPGSLLVVDGCGPKGGPGILRLDLLARSLRTNGLTESVAVVTDGLPPDDAEGTWVSLFDPEAAAGGVIGLLEDGDKLRMVPSEGVIRTGVGAGEFERREPFATPNRAGSGYAARYARSALPALEGGGFG